MDVKKTLYPLAITFILGLSAGCNQTIDVSTSTTATIIGRVIESTTGSPVPDALVEIIPYGISSTTDDGGEFEINIELSDSGFVEVTARISRDGFVTQTQSRIRIRNGNVTPLQDIALVLRQSPGTSTKPSSVVLVSAQPNQIFVRGSGANETSDLTFEVRDIFGRPLDGKSSVRVDFRLQGGPGGGEFISPDTARTSFNGRALTTVHAGQTAGAVQVVASVNGTTVRSAPVPIAIHGWLPDINHFSIGPAQLNFAGYNILGLENQISAFVGDRFSNPVPPGTAVQFQSTGGIIEGSAVTNDRGVATVSLLSARPQPQGVPELAFPFNQPGFAKITAQTVDENNQKISVFTVVLFSGITQITNIQPQTFDLEANSSQSFRFTVSDQNGNPLVAGTSIGVETNSGDVAGDTEVTLKDTQSRAATE